MVVKTEDSCMFNACVGWDVSKCTCVPCDGDFGQDEERSRHHQLLHRFLSTISQINMEFQTRFFLHKLWRFYLNLARHHYDYFVDAIVDFTIKTNV